MNLLKSVLVVCVVSTGCLFMPSKAMKHCDTEILRDKFFDAIKKNNVQELQLYLAENPKMINKVNRGYTPLHYAAICANYEAAEFLLKNGADINKEKFENTPLSREFSTYGGDVSLATVEFLLKSKANVNFQGKYGKTVLHLIAGYEYFNDIDSSVFFKAPINDELAQICLEAGADSNIRDTNYRTPLFTAMLNKRFKMAKAFIEYGGDKDIKCLNECGNYISSAKLATLQGDVKFAKYMLIYAPNNIKDKFKEFENGTDCVISYANEHKRTFEELEN